jgi:hypothetical protein
MFEAMFYTLLSGAILGIFLLWLDSRHSDREKRQQYQPLRAYRVVSFLPARYYDDAAQYLIETTEQEWRARRPRP